MGVESDLTTLNHSDAVYALMDEDESWMPSSAKFPNLLYHGRPCAADHAVHRHRVNRRRKRFFWPTTAYTAHTQLPVSCATYIPTVPNRSSALVPNTKDRFGSVGLMLGGQWASAQVLGWPMSGNSCKDRVSSGGRASRVQAMPLARE